jgi:taurine--2-oxoglutarate transaminase
MSALEWDSKYLVKVEATRDEYEPRFVDSAEGSWLRMANGSRLLDFHSQYMSIGMGHAHPRVREALHRAVDRLGFVSEIFGHEDKARAAKLLAEDTMEGTDWVGGVKFVSTGSEAVEAALLIARLYTNRPNVVVVQNSYHGWTAATAAATTVPYMQNTLDDPRDGAIHHAPMPGGPYYPAPSPYGLIDGESIAHCLRETERLIRSIGVSRVAAFMTEIWHGAGAFMAPDDWVRGIREMCDRLGILLIADEVLAGSGRTGRWWSFQHSGVVPDIMTAAKGLTSSAAPGGAVLINHQIAQTIGQGRWMSFNTFSGHPLAVAAIAATIEAMIDEDVLTHVNEVGAHLERGLADLMQQHRSVGDYTGRGLGWALELVRDRATGARWVEEDRWWSPDVDGEPEFMPAAFVAERCEEDGVLLLNFLPNTVTIAPPLKVSVEEIDIGIAALDNALDELDERSS